MPVVPAAPVASPASLLDQELRTLESFLVLLQQEQTLLETVAIEPLGALAEQKSALTTELARLTDAREAAISRGGFGPGKDGMNAWCETADGNASRGNWQRLRELAAEARALNELNGKLIATRLQHNQKALAVLMAAADRAATYGPDGQQRTGSSGRSLGSA
jgi:flagella synthesis protein FlgN